MKSSLICALLVTLTTTLVYGDGVSIEGNEQVRLAAATPRVADSVTTGVADNTPRYLEFYASDKAAQIRYERDSSVVSVDSGRINIGFLFDEERDNIFAAGLVIDSTPELLPGVTFSFGGKVYAALLGVENSDVFGLGMGIEAAYALPLRKFPLLFEGAIYYSPDVLSFGQADRIIDWQVNVGLRLRKSIVGYAGFRFLEFDTRPGHNRPDNGPHIGIRWNMGV